MPRCVENACLDRMRMKKGRWGRRGRCGGWCWKDCVRHPIPLAYSLASSGLVGAQLLFWRAVGCVALLGAQRLVLSVDVPYHVMCERGSGRS